MSRSARRFVVYPLVVLLTSAAARADDAARQRFARAAAKSIPEGNPDKTLAPYFFVMSEDPDTDMLPLKSTWADVNIDGVIARVTLNQVYKNEGRRPIEAIYIFPASTRAAVHAMRMQVGDRTIEARIRRAEQARKEYERALDEGRTASLLEQKRPNVFQMSVGNILPGDEVRVELEYSELLTPRDAIYEFVLPTVVGPRYAGGENHEDDWVCNPYTTEKKAPAYTFGLQAMLHSPVPIERLSCPSHDAEIEFDGKYRARIDLAPGSGGNRDFILRFRLAGGRIEQGIMLAHGKNENYFLLMMQPPARVERHQVTGREYIFVVDVSGSMYGYPIDVAKKLLRGLLDGLGPQDSFNVVLFSGAAHQLAEKSLPATPANVRSAIEVIDSQRGAGGTEILVGLRRALAIPRRRDQARIFVIVTDGYIRVEDDVFRLIRSNLDRASFFAFGIGTAVNRHLIEGIARAGQAESFVATGPAEAEGLAKKFYKHVGEPVLHDIRIEFEGFDAYDLEPSKAADLFGDRPLVLLGKWRGEPRGRVKIGAEGAGGRFERVLYLRDAVDIGADDTLGLLWARKRIGFLSDCLAYLSGDGSELEKEMTRIGLNYHLLTRFTSFVAIDTVARTKAKATRVKQPLPLPVGVSNSAVGTARYVYSGGKLGLLNRHGRGVRAGSVWYGGGAGFGGLGLGGRGSGGGAVMMGSISHEFFRKKIRDQVSAIRRMYRRYLRKNPSVRGKVVLAITIGPDGKVTKVRVARSDIKDLKFLEKLVDFVKKLRFGPPLGGGKVVVSYPFVFSP